MVENHHLRCIAAESAASRSLGYSKSGQVSSAPHGRVRGVMPTGFAAANIWFGDYWWQGDFWPVIGF
jgi:hypothetical protein